jgi:hypothetical protein
MAYIRNIKTFEDIFSKFSDMKLVSDLWKKMKKEITVDEIAKIAESYIQYENTTWILFYKLYILNRRVNIKIEKELIYNLKKYIETVKLKMEKVIKIKNSNSFNYIDLYYMLK